MRLFFGFDLAPETKASIADWRDRYVVADGRPVPPANFHITLAFLGQVDGKLMERLCDSVDEQRNALRPGPLSITLDGVGYFSSPGAYWLGTGADTGYLATIARKLGSIGQRFGARRERQVYVPHVTLYRRCTSPPPAPIVDPRFLLALNEVTLFESRSGRGGVVYEPRAVWALA